MQQRVLSVGLLVLAVRMADAVPLRGAEAAATPTACEVFIESDGALIAGGAQDRRVMLGFSRRDGKSYPGVAWLPFKRGSFPRLVYVETSNIRMEGNAIAGSFDLESDGVPKHTFAFEGKLDGTAIYGQWRISADTQMVTRTISGRLHPPTVSRDAPMTAPQSVKTDAPWGRLLDTPHPFMLWTRQQAAAIRQRIETDADAKRQYERTMALPRNPDSFKNLFNYLVMGDEKAGQAEKAYLLSFIGCHPLKFYTGIGGGRHFDNYEHALRYDALYDALTPAERQAIETTFRGFLKHHIWEDYKVEYTRMNWLPNMQWPRPMAAHLMAVALRDEEAIRRMFHSIGGWKWYLDEYIADGQFYMEEFAKQYSMMGEMLLWCQGLERLGLDAMGYGYTGRGGATMRLYLEGLYHIALPAAPLEGGRWRFPHIHMGDAGASLLVAGLNDRQKAPGEMYWSYNNMNGRDHTDKMVPKMHTPLWLEIAHAKWPDAKFDYFLAHMRDPGADRYFSSLYFGGPIVDPAKVSPPAAVSYVAPERGFALLRAEEGPAHWTSPRPAVALQFGMCYVHYVHDCFTLLEFNAFNRSLYAKRAFGPHTGYAGGHPWRDTVRGHQGVVVDNRQIQPVDGGDNGCEHQDIRHAFSPEVKFVAVHSKPYPIVTRDRNAGTSNVVWRALYEGVEAERALFLTPEYLLDVYSLASDRSRLYHWNAHPAGRPLLNSNDAWRATNEFDGGKLWDSESAMGMARGGGFDLKSVKRLDVGAADWSLGVAQGGGVGVNVRMLGEEATTLYHDTDGNVTTVLVQRQKPATAFVTLHEPFQGGAPAAREFERVAQTDRAVAVRVSGGVDSPVHDRLLLAYSEAAHEPQTLAGGGESFTFVGHGWLRAGNEKVVANGDFRRIAVRVAGKPSLLLNGKAVPASVQDGVLRFEAAGVK